MRVDDRLLQRQKTVHVLTVENVTLSMLWILTMCLNEVKSCLA
jgi:hypothetical protein